MNNAMKMRHPIWKLVIMMALAALAGCSAHINSVGMEFVQIPADSFVMGADRDSDREALRLK
jgi:uncharacterized membrane protein YoaK (UPF0700 family)